MDVSQGVARVVQVAQQEGEEQKQIAATLLSWAAGYALEIGWSPDLVSASQAEALRLHVERRAERARKGDD